MRLRVNDDPGARPARLSQDTRRSLPMRTARVNPRAFLVTFKVPEDITSARLPKCERQPRFRSMRHKLAEQCRWSCVLFLRLKAYGISTSTPNAQHVKT